MKLHYFAGYARAEPLRLMLHHAGVQYEEVFVEEAEWPKVKPTMPGGSLPVLELPTGEKLGQTCSLARYLGRLHGYQPTDPTLAYLSDALAADFNEAVLMAFLAAATAATAEAKAQAVNQLVAEVLPKFLDKAEKSL